MVTVYTLRNLHILVVDVLMWYFCYVSLLRLTEKLMMHLGSSHQVQDYLLEWLTR